MKASLRLLLAAGVLAPFLWRCSFRTPVSDAPLDEGKAVTKTAPVAPTKWSLWNEGAKLRGANIWQKAIETQFDGDSFGSGRVGPPYQLSELKKLASLGANLVVISHPGLYTERPPYRLDTGIRDNLDALVAMAKKAGLYVVIAFRTGPGRNEAGFDKAEKERSLQTVWSNRAAQDGWVAMWRAAAERYRKEPHVVGYDLLVEPNGNDVVAGTDDPEEFYPQHSGTLADWNPFAARIAEAIRAVDAETPLVVQSMNWGSAKWLGALRPPPQPRVVLSVHHYEPYEYTHQENPQAGLKYPSPKYDRAWLENSLATVKLVRSGLNVPVFVGEYGVMRWEPGAEKYLQDIAVVFDKLALPRAVWLWESEKVGYDDFNYRRGPGPKGKRSAVSSTNPLLDTLQRDWAQNGSRPRG